MDNSFPFRTIQFPKELNLLLYFTARANVGTEGADLEELYADIDWDRFLELAKHHRVCPSLYRSVKDEGRSRVPPHIRQALQHEYKKNVFRMLHLSGEMEQVCTRFAERNIRILHLKGPALAFDLYGDISLRPSKDLDILVDIRDLTETAQLLRQLGYSMEGTVYNVMGGWRWRNYHKPFIHPGKKINVEIHWRLGPGPSKEPDFYKLWERKRSGLIAGCPVHYLGQEDLFYYLVTHGARHGWFRLLWLRDIDRMANQNLNWKMIGLHLERYQALHIGGQALLLASRLLGTPLHEDMRTFVDRKRCGRLSARTLVYLQDKTDLHSDDIPPNIAREYKRYLFSIKSLRQKLLYLLSTLYPHPLDAETLPLPSPVHFLYFPLKPLLWAWRKAKKHAWT